jgi:TolA-binding protein
METRVMKITWTIAALACSVSLVDAQRAPRPAQAPVVVPTPTPAPTPRAPRAPRPLLADEPFLLDSHVEPPSFLDWHIEAPAFPPMEPLMAMAPMEPMAPLAPMIPMEPMTPMPAMEAMAPMAPMIPMTPPTPMAPMVAMPAEPFFHDWFPSQGPTPRPAPARDRELDAELRRLTSELDRAEAARIRAAEAQDRTLQRTLEAQERTLQRQLDQHIRNLEQQDRNEQRRAEQELANAARQAAQVDRQIQREFDQQLRQIEMQDRQVQREFEQQMRSAQYAMTDMARSSSAFDSRRVVAPAPWAAQDVADSAYRQARELFNRGEYGQAVAAFRALPTRYPNSAYAPEAAYYQAFALFRIGGTAELKEALAALEASRTRYPNARSRAEAQTLATRIRGVLASRGDAGARAELARTANEQGPTCDREEQAVQAEAMNALSRSDAGNVNELITRVLARKDECSIPLRRTAIFLVGNRRDAQAVTILAGVARNDPSIDVRVEAISVMSRLGSEETVPVLEELVRDNDERIQRSAIRSLVRHPSARASASVRTLVEREDVSERVRSEALSAFDSERATADDIAWLRTLYTRFTTPTLKARTLSAIVRVGGPEVDQWLITIARDDAQPSELRSTAMRRIGETLPVADLGRLYDTATQQRFRSEIISVLGKRKEDAAADKLIDIVKNGTDPSLRNAAIRAISSKNDPRANQLLLDIINK